MVVGGLCAFETPGLKHYKQRFIQDCNSTNCDLIVSKAKDFFPGQSLKSHEGNEL